MTTSESEIQAIMKDLYENEVPMIGHRDPVAYATITKTTNFRGRSKEFAGTHYAPPRQIAVELRYRFHY